MDRQFRAMGIETLVGPESFFVKAMKKEGPLVDGELERAVSWVLGIQQRYEAVKPHIETQEAQEER